MAERLTNINTASPQKNTQKKTNKKLSQATPRAPGTNAGADHPHGRYCKETREARSRARVLRARIHVVGPPAAARRLGRQPAADRSTLAQQGSAVGEHLQNAAVIVGVVRVERGTRLGAVWVPHQTRPRKKNNDADVQASVGIAILQSSWSSARLTAMHSTLITMFPTFRIIKNYDYGPT
jgi:hypothetical protein